MFFFFLWARLLDSPLVWVLCDMQRQLWWTWHLHLYLPKQCTWCRRDWKKQISCPFPVHVYSVFVLFWYCAIPIFARLQSYEGKLWKMQGLFDGRWSRDNIMASLELSLRCQARRSVAIFFSFLFFPKLAFKTSGGHHSTVYSLSQNKYMPWD